LAGRISIPSSVLRGFGSRQTTIRRDERFARQWGYWRPVVVLDAEPSIAPWVPSMSVVAGSRVSRE
jgi:hypothetical protein